MQGLLIIKPDAFREKIDKEILDILSNRWIVIVNALYKEILYEDLRQLYLIDIYPMSISAHDILLEIYSWCSTILIVEWNDIFNKLMKVKKEIREKYKKQYWYIHTSDNKLEFEREVKIFI